MDKLDPVKAVWPKLNPDDRLDAVEDTYDIMDEDEPDDIEDFVAQDDFEEVLRSLKREGLSEPGIFVDVLFLSLRKNGLIESKKSKRLRSLIENVRKAAKK